MLRIGTIAGSDVLVSSSWFLVAGLIAFLMAPRVEQIQPGLGIFTYVVGVLFAIVLYGAILLHEASHALVARRFGFRVQSITLHFLGGATAIDGEARTPRQEFWIAVVGPITSLAVGGAALALWFVTPGGIPLLIVEGLAWTNLLIGVLNLVPALPLDGGRVLKAGIWALSGQARTGTVVAGWAGRVAAGALVVWALLQAQVADSSRSTISPFMAVIVAVFLWMGASQALQAATVREQLGRIVARDLARRTMAVPEDLPLAEAVRRAQEAHAGSIVTVSAAGTPIGVVDERAATAVPPERRPWVATSTVARTLEQGLTLPVSITGDALVEAIRSTPASEYVLLEGDGTVCGVLATADVVRVVRSGG
ncbi:site-2 protease family protein [Nocardioides sp. GY 10113]|nr:site-2 protease family protein [Nocardioides sp. GY 10113]